MRFDDDHHLESHGNGRAEHRKITPLHTDVTGGEHDWLVRGVVPFEDDEPLTDTPFPETEILSGDAVQLEKVSNAVYKLLDAFNVNWEDPNYADTPQRVAKAYLNYWANGYGRKPENEITTFPNSAGTRDMVFVKDMKYYSTCSHHLAPFHGYGAIAYLPGERLVGLSKLGRILDIYARRFQLQERITAQTADAIMSLMQPRGVMVVLYNSEHMCMSSRGVQLHEANTTTVAARGAFADDAALRAEVFSLLRLS